MRMLAKKWLKALRSGRYTQGFGCLRKKEDGLDEFCCLGVLCDISGIGAWKNEEVRGAVYYEALGDARRNVLPDSVQAAVGISQNFMSELVALNDSGATFNTIAEQIEGRFELSGGL